MSNPRNNGKKLSGHSAASKPNPQPLTATARKVASKKKQGNQASSSENCPQDPSDRPNADTPGEPLAGGRGRKTRRRDDVATQELMEKYTEMQGEHVAVTMGIVGIHSQKQQSGPEEG
jgi:hypothetical protein